MTFLQKIVPVSSIISSCILSIAAAYTFVSSPDKTVSYALWMAASFHGGIAYYSFYRNANKLKR
jgi:hypothetical protein